MGPVEAITTLAAAFQRDLAPETVSIYSAALADIDPALLAAAVRESIATAKFFPAVAELRRTAARIAGLLPPSSGEVLALIRRADVREAVYRRDGSYAYTERYWRWPEDAERETVALCQSVIEKAGEPCDGEGNEIFGWETAARKVYESDLAAIEARVLADLTAARLLPPAPKPKALPAPVRELPARREPDPVFTGDPTTFREELAKLMRKLEQGKNAEAP